jgi:hydrogenase maturation protease
MHFLRHPLPEFENRARMIGAVDGARCNPTNTIKVIGIGQSLRGDDAAGISAVRLWVETYQAQHPQVQVEQAELPGIGLLNLLEGARFAILVDAVHSRARPGTLFRLTEDLLASFDGGSGSAHGWGVAETLSLGRQLTPANLPAGLIVIGIEAGQLDLGEALSPEVQASLLEVASLIEEYVNTALGK